MTTPDERASAATRYRALLADLTDPAAFPDGDFDARIAAGGAGPDEMWLPVVVQNTVVREVDKC